MAVQRPQVRRDHVLILIFGAACILHLVLATYHWKMGYLAGHEFRQTQTAIISYYIDQENNFSPLYETPILGKPWVSILLEVPIYEWSVVGLSRLTHWPHYIAARTITLACFYLLLPAVYLLLGWLEPRRDRRLYLLAAVLCCPVYIYYSRAFLMESMELMCCAWFLYAFVRALEGRSFAWLVLTALLGTLAALIKSATYAIWLLPAAGYALWLIYLGWTQGRDWQKGGRTALWALAAVAVPLASLRWWIHVTDPIKAAHSSAYIFTSKNLSLGNWGLFSFSGLWSASLWRDLFHGWTLAIMPAGLILALIVAGLSMLPSARRHFAVTAGAFFAAQLLFPYAYALQDYYFYACAVFLVAGLGMLMLAARDALPRVQWLGSLLLLLPLVAELRAYWLGYRPDQAIVTDGHRAFTDVVRDLTPPHGVIVVAGADWGAIIPYYAQRRALMIRNGLEHEPAYLEKAIKDLAGEDVVALIVADKVRNDNRFLDQVTAALDMDRTPTYVHLAADVYIRRLYKRGVAHRIQGSLKYNEGTVPPEVLRERPQIMTVPLESAQTAFPAVTPVPTRCYFEFGIDNIQQDGDATMSAHPNSDIWLKPDTGAHNIYWSYGILREAYERAGDKTNGVEFIISSEMPNGETHQIFYRLLDPVVKSTDRGIQETKLSYQVKPGEVLHFFTRPNGSVAYDWAYWKKIDVH